MLSFVGLSILEVKPLERDERKKKMHFLRRNGFLILNGKRGVKDMKRKLITGIMATMLVLFLTDSAQAIIISSLYDYTDTNKLSDDSYEKLVNLVGGTTTLDVGDQLKGILRVDQLVNPVGSYNYVSSGLGDWSSEITAVFQIEAKTKTAVSGGWLWDFGPVSSSTGAMITIYEDPSRNYVYNGTETDSFNSASDGSMYWTLGFLGLLGEGWTAFAPSDDISVLGGMPLGTNAGVVNFAMNLVSIGVGPPLARDQDSTIVPGNFVDLVGNGNIIGQGGGTGQWYDVGDDMNAYIHPIPEPATMFLLGSGLIGLAGFARKKFRKRG